MRERVITGREHARQRKSWTWGNAWCYFPALCARCYFHPDPATHESGPKKQLVPAPSELSRQHRTGTLTMLVGGRRRETGGEPAAQEWWPDYDPRSWTGVTWHGGRVYGIDLERNPAPLNVRAHNIHASNRVGLSTKGYYPPLVGH